MGSRLGCRRWSLVAFGAALLLLAAAPASRSSGQTVRLPAAGELITSRAVVRAAPAQTARALRVLHRLRPDGQFAVVLAIATRRSADGHRWYELSLPGRPNGQRGWVRDELLDLHTVANRIVVRVGERRSSCAGSRTERLLLSGVVAVGKPGAETPLGRRLLRAGAVRPSRPVLRPFVLETSAYSKLSDWPGGGSGGHPRHEPAPTARPGRVARLRARLGSRRARSRRGSRRSGRRSTCCRSAAQPVTESCAGRGRRAGCDSRARPTREARRGGSARGRCAFGVTARWAMPRRSVMHCRCARRSPPRSPASPASGFPKRVRAWASTIEVAPACSGAARRSACGRRGLRPRLYGGLLRLARRIGDANERRGGVVEVVRFLFLGADADDVQRPADGATLRDDRDRGRARGEPAEVAGVLRAGALRRRDREHLQPIGALGDANTFTSAASTGEEFVTVTGTYRWPSTAIVGWPSSHAEVDRGGGRRHRDRGIRRRRGDRGDRRQRHGQGVVRVFVNVHTTTSPLAIAPSTFVPGTETCRLAVPGAVDLSSCSRPGWCRARRSH